MTKKRFASVWDAIEDTPEKAENMKLRSSLTLFTQVSANALYGATIQRWFGGADPATVHLLESMATP